MNISYISMQFPTPSETFAGHDVNTLAQRNNTVTVYTLKNKHRAHSKLIKERGLSAISIETNSLKNSILGTIEIMRHPLLFMSLLAWMVKCDLSKPRYFFRSLLFIPISFKILRRLKVETPDLVHLFWGHYPSIVGFLIKEELPNVHLSFFIGAYDLEYNLGISRYLSYKADFIFTHSKANIPIMQRYGINTKDAHVVHRGIRVENYSTILHKVKKDENLWITVGRLIPSKGIDVVIDLFDQYRKQNKQAKLIILGEGYYREELELQVDRLGINSSVQFLGHVDQRRVFQLLAKASFFLLFSSKSGERLPNVVKEAMLAKCVCFSSNTLGIDELITHGQNGFIFNPEEYYRTVDIISNIRNEDKEKIKHLASKKITESFDVQVSMDMYLTIWKDKVTGGNLGNLPEI